jgi:two-component system OmpR family response regulator
VVEDDTEILAYLAQGLREQGFTIDCANNGRDGLDLALGENYDAVIVDRMLPGVDGLGMVRTMRTAGRNMPVVILSALGEVDERIRGLREGGDDYITKPFAFGELLARIDALLRRSTPAAAETVLKLADLKMDLLARTVRRGGTEIPLQPCEFKLLEYLLRNTGIVVSRTMLFEKVWDYHFDPHTNVIDVHIGRLRKKIDRGFDPLLIHTVRGSGYVLRVAA